MRRRPRIARPLWEARVGRDPRAPVCRVACILKRLLHPLAVCPIIFSSTDAGWSSLAARRAHNPKVVGSNPTPATKIRDSATATYSRSQNRHTARSKRPSRSSISIGPINVAMIYRASVVAFFDNVSLRSTVFSRTRLAMSVTGPPLPASERASAAMLTSLSFCDSGSIIATDTPIFVSVRYGR